MGRHDTKTVNRINTNRVQRNKLEAAFGPSLEALERRALLTIGFELPFGSGGFVTTDVSGGTDEAYSMAVLADGKILVAGNAANGGSDFARARSNAHGTAHRGVGARAP